MTLLNILKTSETPTTNTARPDERRAQLEQIVRQHAVLREAVSGAQIAFETHDCFLRNRYLNPTGIAQTGPEDSTEEERRRSLRQELREAQLALVDFERKHDLPAVEAELADIRANGDAREGAAARLELIAKMVAFEAEILRTGEARWSEIAQLGDEIERRWPGERLTMDLPPISPSIFTTGGGLRSIPAWFGEMMCQVEPEFFEADDPVLQKIDRTEGGAHDCHLASAAWR